MQLVFQRIGSHSIQKETSVSGVRTRERRLRRKPGKDSHRAQPCGTHSFPPRQKKQSDKVPLCQTKSDDSHDSRSAVVKTIFAGGVVNELAHGESHVLGIHYFQFRN